MSSAAAAGLLRSAHDCSDGGIAVTLAECCFDTGGIGVSVELDGAGGDRIGAASALFSETASRIVVSVAASNEEALLRRAQDAGVPARRIGTTGGSRIEIAVEGRKVIDLQVSAAERTWATALEMHFKRAVA